MVGAIGHLPDMMAEDRNGRRTFRVIGRSKQPPRERAHTERGEITGSHVFGVERSGNGFGAFTPDAHASAGGLKSSHIFEFRCFGFEPFVQRKRKHSPMILQAGFDAAIVAFADA